MSKRVVTLDRVRGAFLGIAIGDALGMPVETFKSDRIAADYGRIDRFYEPKDHKWFKGEPAGMVTDDTQLTIAVAEAMIEGAKTGNPLSMDLQAAYHVASLKNEGTKGWGNSTRDSVRRLANGVHWKKSGEPLPAGTGNGVPMKVMPLGLWLSSNIMEDGSTDGFFKFMAQFSNMTHQTSISFTAGLVQALAVYCCATVGSNTIDRARFISILTNAAEAGSKILPETLSDNLYDNIKLLADYEQYDTPKIIEQFGGGSCYCNHSVPFTLMFFVKNPTSIESLYDVVSAGGDTDSNGSMLASLLGVLHGVSIFPAELVESLPAATRERMLDVADRFYENVL